MAASLEGGGSVASFAWAGDRLNVRALESALARLREEAGGVSAGGRHPFVTRTSVLNLVAYAEDTAAAREAAQVIARLEEHPSRSIILVAKPAAVPSVEGRISAHCHVAGPQRRVCCDEIELTVKGPAADHLHSVVLPLLVPDLPVVCWWRDDLPADTHTLDDLLEVADRILVDSARFSASGLPRLAGLCRRHFTCGIGDFNWARLRAWRELAAQLFDTPALAPYLASISGVEIEYAVAGNSVRAVQALLLAAWLAVCLGWRATAPLKDGRCRFQGGQGAVELRLRGRRARGVESGHLLSLKLRAGDASFDIRRSDDPQALVTAVEAPEAKLERTVRIGACGEVEMLSDGLSLAVRDHVFEEALAIAASLADL